MAVREWDGTDDRIVCAGTGTAVCNGAYTIVDIVKSITLDEGAFIGLQNGAETLLGSLADGGGGGLETNTTTVSAGSGTGLGVTAGVWEVRGVSKPAGTSAPRFHRSPLASASWTHLTSGDTVANDATVCDRIEIGAYLNGNFSSPANHRRITLAVFEGVALSDAQWVSIQATPTTQNLVDLGATNVWDFDQASAATPVADLVGPAEQTSIVGTTVITGDDPGWTTGADTAPENTAAPVVSGTTEVAETLSTTNGTWAGDPAPTFTYQWQRDNLGGGTWTSIGGATASTHVVVEADLGCMVRCVVTATNTVGSAAAASNGVGLIGLTPTCFMHWNGGRVAVRPRVATATGAYP